MVGTFFLFIIFTFPVQSNAQEDGNRTAPIVNVRNAGAFVCKDVLPVLSSPGYEIEKTAFIQWTAAYATAISRLNGLIDVFPLSDTAEFVLMVSLICRENINISFETALRVAIGRLRDYWIRTSPNILELNDPGGRKVILYTESVRQIQIDLQRFGIDVNVDGNYGNKTGNAIRTFNRLNGYTPWLTPDGSFLYVLTKP